MKFQPGDKVSFINEKQHGIVKRIMPGNMVVVEIEDGFEFPVRENELVKTGIVQPEPVPEKKEEETVTSADNSALSDLCPAGSTIIAAVPGNTGGVLTGPVAYYLINRSDFEIAYTFYYRKDKEWKGLSRGISSLNTEEELCRFRRDELTDVQSFLFQGLLFSKDTLQQVSSIRNEFAVLLPSLNNARKEIQGTASFAATVTIFTEAEDEIIPVKDLIQKFQSEKQTQAPKNKSSDSTARQPGKYGILINEKEVDLHIEELVSDISGMSNAQMMDIQLKHFSREMDHAIRNHFKKIVFIHGVGNGKLKNEIRKELRNYPGVAFRDADPRNYGQGATEVTFI